MVLKPLWASVQQRSCDQNYDASRTLASRFLCMGTKRLCNTWKWNSMHPTLCSTELKHQL